MRPAAFRCEQFCFARFTSRRCGARVFQIRGAKSQQPSGVEFGGHFGEFLLNQLMTDSGGRIARAILRCRRLSSSARRAMPTRRRATLARNMSRVERERKPIARHANHVSAAPCSL